MKNGRIDARYPPGRWMACHSPGARKRMPVHAAGTYGILQTPGGQGIFLHLDWDSGFLFAWEVTKSQEVLAMCAAMTPQRRR